MSVLAPSTAVVADGVARVVRRAGLGRGSVTHGAQRGRGGEAEYGKELRNLNSFDDEGRDRGADDSIWHDAVPEIFQIETLRQAAAAPRVPPSSSSLVEVTVMTRWSGVP